MDPLVFLLSRPVIIAGAVLGALIASLGPILLRKFGIGGKSTGKVVARIGYGVSWLSVALCIASGFFYNFE